MTKAEWKILHDEWEKQVDKISREASKAGLRAQGRIRQGDREAWDRYVSGHNAYIASHPLPPEPKLGIWQRDIGGDEATQDWLDGASTLMAKAAFAVTMAYAAIGGLIAGDILSNLFIMIAMVVILLFVACIVGNTFGHFYGPILLALSLVMCISSLVYYDIPLAQKTREAKQDQQRSEQRDREWDAKYGAEMRAENKKLKEDANAETEQRYEERIKKAHEQNDR